MPRAPRRKKSSAGSPETFGPTIVRPAPKVGARARLQRYFLTGFIVTAPLAITAYLTWSFIRWVDGFVKPYIPRVYNPETYLPFELPGFGLVAAVVIITMVGFLTANFVGKTIVSTGEKLLDRTPFIRSVYKALKQIFETVFADSEQSFQRVALIEYPRKGLWALVFIATDTRGEVGVELNERGKDTVAVFLPTTPNPTSGFLLFVPKPDLIDLSMSIEEAAKLVISAGLVTPEVVKEHIADDADRKRLLENEPA